MKLKYFPFIVLLPLVFLSSCNPPAPSGRVELVYGNKDAVDAVEITSYETISSMFLDKQNFVIVVHNVGTGCSCWNTFNHLLKDYVSANDLIVYKTPYTTIFDQENKFGLFAYNDRPSIYTVKAGKVIQFDVYDTSKGDDLFHSESRLDEWFKKYTIAPKMFYINKTTLDEKLNSNKPFTIYYGRKTCGDCKFIDWKFLSTYVIEMDKMKEAYIIDCDVPGIRLNEDGTYNETQWVAFKDNYGLSNVNNEMYGYGVGYVPTFHYIDNNDGGDFDPNTDIKDAAVYLNDTIKKEGNTYSIDQTFYTTERASNLHYGFGVEHKVLQGIEIAADDIIEYSGKYYLKQEKAAIYHDPLLDAFLTMYAI